MPPTLPYIHTCGIKMEKATIGQEIEFLLSNGKFSRFLGQKEVARFLYHGNAKAALRLSSSLSLKSKAKSSASARLAEAGGISSVERQALIYLLFSPSPSSLRPFSRSTVFGPD